ncbi:MAG TPA: prolyl oligopeptidase family serine peptidase [Gemmatimonadaceae bacterium]|nr:prolyl oligopeptidase family serine peptidase [Gemmatimonadaceae bacterium]
MKRPALHSLTRSALVLLAALAMVPAARARAQDDASPHKRAPDGKKVLTLADYPEWKRITGAAISNDGKWTTYTYAPNAGDDTLFVKQLDGATLYRVPTGSAAGGGRGRGGFGGGGGGGAQFTDDSHWVAYFVNPPAPAPAPGARGRGRNGGGTQPQRHLELRNLASGDTWDVTGASAFQFSPDSRFLAIKMRGTPGDSSHQGTDLLLRRLDDGLTRNVGNVDQYAFDYTGGRLAYTVDAADNLGNGVYLMDLGSGTVRTLDAHSEEYDGLAWRDSSADLVALRGETASGQELRANTLLVWTGVEGAKSPLVWDPTQDATFPAGYVLSEYSAPQWSRDGARVFVGIKRQQEAPPKGGAEIANVDVWHHADVDLQSAQMIQIGRLRRATLASSFTLASHHFAQLADSNMSTVTPAGDGAYVVGRDPSPYDHDFSEGAPDRADYYRVNSATGQRTLIARHLLRTMGTSPDGRWFLYLLGGHVMAYDLQAGRTVNVDAATGRSFVNTDDDHAAEKPIWGVAGWTRDGKAVLLYDKYDIWELPLDGSRGRDLTAGAGAAQDVQFRLARLGGGGRGGRGGFGGGSAEPVDLSQPQVLSAYGEWTKKSGYWQMPAGGGQPVALIWADKDIGGAEKAEDADRVIFTQQTFQEFPDYWVSDASFASPRKITDANPQLAEYAWGRRVLIDYKNSKGQRLQGTLTLPADYQPGRKYPMLVYIYEILSNTNHQFSMPVYDDRPHMSEYASDGYLVFSPDIVYEIGKPGSSALDCVTAGVKKVISLGYADPAHIGLQGHSWGGYESSFILTQTNMFAAVVTGAPLTDLISMYGELYKQSGQWNGGILETSQGRMGADVTPWNATQLYMSQSPVFNVRKIQTPFMILQGTADGAVDWDQGLEFYNAARKNGKDVIWLSYPDEPHHLARKPNQIDFQIRMKEFFDHYLKGAPAPDWMKYGVPQVDKQAATRKLDTSLGSDGGGS